MQSQLGKFRNIIMIIDSMMAGESYSAKEIALTFGVHVKTGRRYVHDILNMNDRLSNIQFIFDGQKIKLK